MLDLDATREGATPRDAATLVLVKDGARGGARALEIFCVERHKRSGFLGGAVVFPGGKVDARDFDAAWAELTTAPRTPRTPIADDDAKLRALALAACRESLEEAAILPHVGGALVHDDLLTLRARLAKGDDDLAEFLRARSLRIDLAALHPFARWVTPTAEARRFDARFFLAVADADLRGAHDERETTSSFWAAPREILARFEAGEIMLAPPTHRTIELLAGCTDSAGAIAWADAQCLEPICPRLVPQHDTSGDTMALVLPGDPEHEVKTARVAGKSRYVLRGAIWLPEDAPP